MSDGNIHNDALLGFDIEESKSPRILWMEKHGIKVIDTGRDCEPGDECPETGAQLYRFSAHIGDGRATACWEHSTGWGDTEDEAIVQLALKLGIKMWHEEGAV